MLANVVWAVSPRSPVYSHWASPRRFHRRGRRGTRVLAGVALVVAGLMQSGVQVTRALSLRAALPPSAHAAAYSVLPSPDDD